MKTTDGHELTRFGYYYSRLGEQLLLEDWAEGQQGPIYLVSRFYEGEAMEAQLYPSGHTEITVPYEHTSEIVEPVKEIFKNKPIFLVDEEYKKEAEKVLELSRSIGFLRDVIDNLKKEERSLRLATESATKSFEINKLKLDELLEKVEEAKESLDEYTHKISDAEDRLGDLTATDNNVMVDREELGQLRKDSFKLTCLENGGVDNWEWYCDSLKDYYERYPS